MTVYNTNHEEVNCVWFPEGTAHGGVPLRETFPFEAVQAFVKPTSLGGYSG